MDALSVLYAQLTRDLLAIVKFLYHAVLTAYPFLDPGLNEKIFTDTAGSAMMDTPGKN